MDEVFSDDDIDNARQMGVVHYIVTPGGTLRTFDPSNNYLTVIPNAPMPMDPNYIYDEEKHNKMLKSEFYKIWG